MKILAADNPDSNEIMFNFYYAFIQFFNKKEYETIKAPTNQHIPLNSAHT